MLGFLQSLKGLVRASNTVAMITFPASLLSSNFAVRWQHMADILLSVEAVPGAESDLMLFLPISLSKYIKSCLVSLFVLCKIFSGV